MRERALAYVAVAGEDGRPVLATVRDGDKGYRLVPEDCDAGGAFDTWAAADAAAERFSARAGTSPRRARGIILRSMRPARQ